MQYEHFFLRIWLITFVWVNCLHVHTGLRKSLQSQKSWDLRLWRLWDVDVDRRLRGSPTLTSSTSATPTVTLQVSHSYSSHTHTHTPKKKNETSKVTLPVCQYLFPYKITPSKKKFIFMKDRSMNTLNFWISETKFFVVLYLNTEINKAIFLIKNALCFQVTQDLHLRCHSVMFSKTHWLLNKTCRPGVMCVIGINLM